MMASPATDSGGQPSPTYRYDHMHVRSRDVKRTAEYGRATFDAEIVESRNGRRGGAKHGAA